MYSKRTFITVSLIISAIFIFIPFSAVAGLFDGTHLKGLADTDLPPYTLRDNDMVDIAFTTTPEVINELVPEPMVPNPDNEMHIYIARFNVVKPKAFTYHEAALYIPVTYKGESGLFIVVLYLDNMGCITMGREVWGFNKYKADITFKMRNDNIYVKVKKDGVTIIKMKFKYTQSLPVPDVEPPTCYIVKNIPHVDGNKRAPALKRLIKDTVGGYTMKSLSLGDVKLRFKSTKTDPLGDIPIIEILSGAHTVSDQNFTHGEVLYDYILGQ